MITCVNRCSFFSSKFVGCATSVTLYSHFKSGTLSGFNQSLTALLNFLKSGIFSTVSCTRLVFFKYTTWCLASSPLEFLNKTCVLPKYLMIQYSPLYLAFAVWSLNVTKSPGWNAQMASSSSTSLLFLAIWTF